jgi:hypothetical protein
LSRIAIEKLNGAFLARLYAVSGDKLKASVALTALGVRAHDKEGVAADTLSRIAAIRTIGARGIASTTNEHPSCHSPFSTT